MRTVSALVAALSLAAAPVARAADEDDGAAPAAAAEAPPKDEKPPVARPWDTRFFDLPTPAGSLRPRDPILEERLTEPWIEQRAKEKRFAAVTVGAGAGLLVLGGLTFLGGVIKEEGNGEGTTAKWVGGVGAGLGLLVFGTGLFTYATLPGPPEGDLAGR